MSAQYFIALDTHCEFCEMVVVSKSGKIVKRERCETTIPALVAALESVRRPRLLTFEEGPLADWLARSLRPHVERLIVCEPRRNALIAKESDKDDPVDAERLAQLLRGGYLKEVHQAQSLDRAVLKQHVSFYHDRVRERVRQGHQLTAQLRRHGVFASIADVVDAEQRPRLWKQLPQRKVLRTDLELLLKVYELLVEQEEQLRAELVRLARREEPVRRFQQLPGFGWVRSLTFYVYIDTPSRFASKSALWRYCGIGLERRHSGSGPTKVRLTKGGNRRLKDLLLGAAKSAAAQGDNPFADKYAYWTKEEGLHPSTARRNVARCLASTL
jgi:transposase